MPSTRALRTSLIAAAACCLVACSHGDHDSGPDSHHVESDLTKNYVDYMFMIDACVAHPALREVYSREIQYVNGAPDQYARLSAEEIVLYRKIRDLLDSDHILWVMCNRDKNEANHPMEAVSFELYHSQLTSFGPSEDEGIEYMFVSEAEQKSLVERGWDKPMERKGWYYFGISD